MFVAQSGLTRRLAVDLLDKMNNPDNHQHYSEVDDDDIEVQPSAFTSLTTIHQVIRDGTEEDYLFIPQQAHKR